MNSKTAGSLPPYQNWGSGKMGPRVTCPITCGFSGATSRDGVHFVYLGVGEPRKGKAEEATLPTGGCRIKTNKKPPSFWIRNYFPSRFLTSLDSLDVALMFINEFETICLSNKSFDLSR
ncbi:hypothetical protein CEXT_384061 [Caerostris extrusa]|uniref:Uncharacterized protein n=1 Tax=Caerostris extrusa TaxID=172846 RepID=A0AAV4Y7Y5_CAEEX|nr:hypothetical protein CEXT_384061 [Caerostris extrusa]